VIEERNVQDAAVLLNELIQADPLVPIDVFVYHIYLLITCSKSDLLLEFTYV
jgi:hypothetical protein